MDLDELADLTPKCRAHLRKAGYTTTHELLCTPTNALQRRTGLPPDELEACVHTVSAARLPACVSVAEALKRGRPPTISLGAGNAFNELLGGGIRAGSLTEVVGESATGKSNLCMQLAIQAQLPVELGGLAASALYLTSETSQSAFPSNRLLQLARAMRAKLQEDDRVPDEKDLLANVHLGNAAALEPLDLIISHHASHLARELVAKKRPRLGLIIVDSLAAPSRADFATNTLSGLSDRAKALALVGDKLKQIAYDLQLAVVVVNQVSDVFQEDLPSAPSTPGAEGVNGDGPTLASNGEGELHLPYDSQARFFSGQAPALAKQAALGLVWANAVDTRVMLSHTGRVRKLGDPSAKMSIRRATVVYSPFAPPASIDYVIEEGGLRAISDRYQVGERWAVASSALAAKSETAEKDLLPSSEEDEWNVNLASENLRLVMSNTL